ncbi:MAG: cell division protein FtsL [Silicimonas sp.]|nr:cell division protein FtsL [Silicimonas sp.]NNF91528.1 cell division protein FtsL [Boseongicola sp.]RZW07797.1 MAG: cell division protein FtsL [Paracoccaceae bacterium]MBT8425015.1 cell division protein FtsL [Silicimonas sp.]NND42161.1 cell division protein FtsL [Silicimonas sp.]
MKSFFYVVTAFAVMGLAIWAYRQNYETQAKLREVRELRAEIADLRERASVLRAEWAYLNRPERLADLADLNFDRLGLLPLRPDHFGDVDLVSYPIENVVEVMDREVSE